MRKRILFIITVLLTVCNFLGSAANTAETLSVNEQNNSNTIELRGDLPKSGGFRSGTDPIVAELQGKTLFVHFEKRDMDVLQVTVTGAQGQVFIAYVDTATQSTLSIPLAGLPAGNYTVTFSNERGSMWGGFDV